MPPPTRPPQIVSQITSPVKTPTYAEAETALFAALDSGDAPPRAKALRPNEQAAYAWLWNSATWKPGMAPPASPFAKGSAADKEAQAWRVFLKSGKEDPSNLPLTKNGSRLLLWTWLRDRDRHGGVEKAERARIEDRLLEDGPSMLLGWTLRHALCFALADKDGVRFSALKSAHGGDSPETFTGIQALFGLMGGPSPRFRLWTLPGLAYQDATLGELGARRVWVCPPGIPAPEGAAWIIPSATGEQSSRDAELSPAVKMEAGVLAAQVKGRAAWFAPARDEWEGVGLQWFPILIELDKDGNLASVRMGDAAP